MTNLSRAQRTACGNTKSHTGNGHERMINYSVYMMDNQFAKDKTPRAYAKNQVGEVWPIEKFVKHIASHNGAYSRGTVKGVICDMCECLVEQLLNGNKIQLGELGTFGISLCSEGAESIEKFTAKNIRAVNIVFTPGEDFENLIGRADFNPVPSRAAQAATLKAEKAGETTVDLEAAKKKKPQDEKPATPTDPDEGGSGSGDQGGDGTMD